MREELKKRIQKTQEEARARLAKRGVMRFRCSEIDILRLNEFAYKSGFPVGTLIRKWVFERLEQELHEGTSTTSMAESRQPKLTALKTEIKKELNDFDKRLKAVEKVIRQAR